MELEFTDRSRRRRLLLIIGLILAILAGSTAFFLGNQQSADAEPAAMRRVLVAADTIPARTIIQASHLVTRDVPDDPSLALAVTDPGQVLGLVTAVTVYADQPITPNLIATTAVGQQFSILAPTETISPYSPVWRAVSVSVPRDRAVGGLVTPGQRVDLIATVAIEIRTEDENGQLVEGTTLDGYYTNESTKVVMTDVEVLSQEPDSDIYVLKVDLHQAEEIAVLQAKGAAMNLALRPQGDNRVIDRDGYGETVNRVVEEYLFPLPRVIQVDRYPKPEAEVVPEGSPTVEWPDPDPALVPDASLEPGASPQPVSSPEPSPEPSPQAGRNRG
jgi:pilus assembly protein CpaB